MLAGVVKRVGPDHLQVIAINYRDEYEPFKYVVKVLKDYPITFLRDAQQQDREEVRRPGHSTHDHHRP